MPEHYDPDSFEEGGYPLFEDSNPWGKDTQLPQPTDDKNEPSSGMFPLAVASVVIIYCLLFLHLRSYAAVLEILPYELSRDLHIISFAIAFYIVLIISVLFELLEKRRRKRW